ncbi:MAG TPA: cell envelope integrity protein CreD, partial [Candidatus Kapabacteria bacterium]|nr:cell envelope integrity protein CreD [Candidatus Kapabacteria bacterium]
TQDALQGGILLPAEQERRHAVFLPAELQLQAVAEPEIRYRGLYQVPLYQAALELNARFDAPDLAALHLKPEQMLWQEARVVVHVSDIKALTGALNAVWNEQPLDVLPGTTSEQSGDGFHFPVPLAAPEAPHQFHLRFQLHGSNQLFVTPAGKRSTLQMSGQWPAPSFQGEWLPSTRTVDAGGFSAQWDIPFIAKGMPMQWEGESANLRLDGTRWVGVKLQPEMDAYRKNQRSTKYQLLFLVMIFGFFWLFQWLTGIGVHPLQYLLTGASMCVFYLLLLSLSEHLGFFTAYVLASAALVVQIGLYARSVLQSWKRAGGMALMLAGLLGYLGSLLQEQDFALLYGSLGVFAALSVVMYLTRRLQQVPPSQAA